VQPAVQPVPGAELGEWPELSGALHPGGAEASTLALL
jgi:hypothetical protein